MRRTVPDRRPPFACGNRRFAAVLGTLIVLGAVASNSFAGPVPLPRLRGPLPDPVARGIRVWDVSQLNYVASEFLVSGRASVYAPIDMADSRAMSFSDRVNTRQLAKQTSYTPKLRQPSRPYTTRIIVYRPGDPKRFSGNVIMEITHPAGGGFAAVWGSLNGFFIAHGDAYVVVQHPLTFQSLRAADPQRYGSLREADPTQVWGMVAQVGALIRSDSPASPLAGYSVKYLFLTGYSYTGVGTATFADYYHDGATLAGGAPVFSGYLPFANGTYVRPLDVPVIRVNTQSDFNSYGGLANRRMDSDAPAYRYRLYEVAGASHVNSSPTILPEATPPRPVRLRQAAGLPPGGGMKSCLAHFPPGAQPNSLPLDYVLAQAFLNMYRWVGDGVAPPRTPFIATGADGKPKLDRNGNAIGGLRLPALTVPAATYGIAPGACWLLGYVVPFTRAKMKALYGTRAAYAADVQRAAAEDAARGLISASAARAITARARAR
jgi:Alpha/beta hydrolase domain